MIVPGDRVLLGLSGGKDSLAMLHLLKALQNGIHLERLNPAFVARLILEQTPSIPDLLLHMSNHWG